MSTKDDKDILPFTHAEERLLAKLEQRRGKVEERFPLVVALLATFGFVSTLYGFEKVIDKVPFFSNHPWTLLVMGISVLALTGAIYKKLD